MALIHNKLYKIMKENNIDTRIININNLEYFTVEQIKYILALNLNGYKLKSIIYLTSIGLFNRIDPKMDYLIVRAIKRASNEVICNKVCEILIRNNDFEESIKQISIMETQKEEIKPEKIIKLKKVKPYFMIK